MNGSPAFSLGQDLADSLALMVLEVVIAEALFREVIWLSDERL